MVLETPNDSRLPDVPVTGNPLTPFALMKPVPDVFSEHPLPQVIAAELFAPLVMAENDPPPPPPPVDENVQFDRMSPVSLAHVMVILEPWMKFTVDH